MTGSKIQIKKIQTLKLKTMANCPECKKKMHVYNGAPICTNKQCNYLPKVVFNRNEIKAILRKQLRAVHISVARLPFNVTHQQTLRRIKRVNLVKF